jgi:hypothetical protein
LEISLIKYDIQGIVPLAKKYLEGYIKTDTIAVFAIACRYEWKDLATDAARISLTLPLRSFTEPIHGLQYVAANRYHALLRYNAECSAVCMQTTTVIRWIKAPPQQVWFKCTSCSTNPAYLWYLSDGELWPVRDWFLSYMKAADGQLLFDERRSRTTVSGGKRYLSVGQFGISNKFLIYMWTSS